MSGDTLNSSLQQLNWLLVKNSANAHPVEQKDKKDKPNLSYSQLIREAIESAQDRKTTLSGIYDAISSKYPYYANCPTTTWKNSVRHNLSLNKTFLKLDKANGGKGSFWTIAVLVNGPPKTVKDPPTSSLSSPPIPQMPPIIPSPQIFYHPPYPSSYHLPPPPIPPPQMSYLPSTSSFSVNDLEEDPSLSLPPGMSLFDSQDLSSSFRCVYDQVFHNRLPVDAREEETRIDWLKIGLETAGIDYRDNEEMANVRTDAFIEMLENDEIDPLTPPDGQFTPIPSYSSFCHQYEERKRTADTNLNELNYTNHKQRREENIEDEEEDEFDWNSIVN